MDRAALIAKVQGAKRKRGGDDGMDVDEDVGEDGEDAWMDVDGEEPEVETRRTKRSKANSGKAVMPKTRRDPKTNRQLAGLRDEAVRLFAAFTFGLRSCFVIASSQGEPAPEPRPTSAEHVCQSRRGRSSHPNQNGERRNFHKKGHALIRHL